MVVLVCVAVGGCVGVVMYGCVGEWVDVCGVVGGVGWCGWCVGVEWSGCVWLCGVGMCVAGLCVVAGGVGGSGSGCEWMGGVVGWGGRVVGPVPVWMCV